MDDLFSTQASNAHQCLLLRHFDDDWIRVSGRIHCEPMLSSWRPLQFELQVVDKMTTKTPSICTVYLPGFLAFPVAVKDALFPAPSDKLEFLPIHVGIKPWFLLSCLDSVKSFDERESQVWRGLEGQILMVRKLTVTDPRARDLELFTLDGSNRGELFVRTSFKERVERLGLEGITFEYIGEVI